MLCPGGKGAFMELMWPLMWLFIKTNELHEIDKIK